MRSAGCTALALAVLNVMPAHAAGPFGSIKVENWKGGAYTNDKTSAFSHCGAGAAYLNGVSVNISRNVADQWVIGFGSTSFHLTIGETIPVNLIFDGQTHLQVFGIAATPQVFAAPLPGESVLQKSHLMVAQIKGTTYQFQLRSIDRVVAAVASCVAKTKITGISAAGDFSNVVPKPLIQTLIPAPTTTPLPTTTPPTATPMPTTSPLPPMAPQPDKPTKSVERSGTGIVISRSGHVLTNNHVVAGCTGDIHANLAGEASVVLRPVSKDQINDLALLQAPQTFDEPAAIRSTAIHPGDAIVVIGYPFHGLLTSDFTVTSGIISSLSGLLNDTRYLQISAEVQSGNSGGPLLDTSGNVVGVVSSKLNAVTVAKATGDLPQNINFAIKTGALRDFLDNGVVSYKTAESNNELKTAEIARQARTYTMLISCTAKVPE
jgi:S1-C subfamily serine protease